MVPAKINRHYPQFNTLAIIGLQCIFINVWEYLPVTRLICTFYYLWPLHCEIYSLLNNMGCFSMFEGRSVIFTADLTIWVFVHVTCFAYPTMWSVPHCQRTYCGLSSLTGWMGFCLFFKIALCLFIPCKPHCDLYCLLGDMMFACCAYSLRPHWNLYICVISFWGECFIINYNMKKENGVNVKETTSHFQDKTT